MFSNCRKTLKNNERGPGLCDCPTYKLCWRNTFSKLQLLTDIAEYELAFRWFGLVWTYSLISWDIQCVLKFRSFFTKHC